MQTRKRAPRVSWGRERLVRELTQEVVREPGGVEHCEDGEGLGDRQGEALVVLQGGDLGVQSVSAVLGGEAEEIVDGEFDGVRFGGDSRRR